MDRRDTIVGGRYRLEELTASASDGDTWRAVDVVIGHPVAVKVLARAVVNEPGFRERFLAEARRIAAINHRGVASIYDLATDPAGSAFLIAEYVHGTAISDTLARLGRLTSARTMSLLAQAADALHVAHQQGVVHGQLQASNLVVRTNDIVVLTDFGLARPAVAIAGSILDAAAYISPEQAMGGQPTRLSDIYALGVVAYECLAGRRPFEADNPLEIAMRHVRADPPPLPADVPPAARLIVERAMAKDPGQRWPTAAELTVVARDAAG